MARDVLITPASGLVDFLDTSVSKASITLGTDGILTLTGGANPIVFQTSTSGSSVLRVDGTSGTIFEVTDDLSNSLMSVNTIAGLPVFEVFADNHIVAGRYNQNDFYLDTNGNLGLGTSAPSSVLDVYEQSGKDNKLRFHNDTTGSGTSNGSRIGLNGAELFINNIENNAIKIYTQSTQTNGITILGDGKVGIGTTSPSTDFSVKGHLLFTDTTRLLTISNNTNTGGIDLDGGNSRLYFSGYRALEGNNSGSLLYVGEGYTTTKISSVLNVIDHETILSPDQGSSSGVASRALTIENINDANWTADALTAYNATTIYDIRDRASYSFFARPTQGNILTFASETSNQGTTHKFVNLNSSAVAPLYIWDFFQYDGSGTGTGDFKVPDKLFQIRVREGASTVEKFTIKGNGNVGIGTDNPDYKLQVNEKNINNNPSEVVANINTNDSGYNTLLISNGGTDPQSTPRPAGIHFKSPTFGATNSYSSGRIISYFDTTGGTNPGWGGAVLGLQYPTADNTFTTGLALRDGNVGIGTTSPSKKLHVAGSTLITNNNYHYGFNTSGAQTALVGIKSNNYVTLGQQNLNHAGTDIYSGTGSIYFYHQATNRLIISSDVNVQGATDLNINGSNRRLSFASGTGTIRTTSANKLYLQTNSTDALTIDASQNVGIGTGSPAYTLHVQGTGYFSSNLLSSGLTAQTNSNYIRESSDQIRYLSRINGRNINHNAQFINGTASGYGLYNNSGGSATSISVIYYTSDTAISTSAIPNSNGHVLKISYTSGAGNTSPGFGGFYLGATNSETINSDKLYKQKNRIIHRIWAKIPSGKSLGFASNAYGTNGSFTWLTPTGGNGDWYEYIGVQQIGYGGSFSSTSYFYVSGGSNTSFNWYVAECSLIDVDCPSDILYSPGLSIGYASGASYNSVQAGWGGLGVKNNAIIGGSVGIGTVSPNHELEVAGAGDATIRLTSTSTNISDDTRIGTLQYFSSDTSSNTVVGEIVSRTPVGNFGNVFDLAFSTYNISQGALSEKMRIIGAGNVGIGTATPATKLDIYGEQYNSDYPSMLRVIDNVTAFDTDNNGGGISFGGRYTSGDVVNFLAGIQGVKENNTSGNYGGALRFLIRENGTSVFTEKMRIDRSGNVGIGTANPSTKLEIVGETKSTNYRFSGPSDGGSVPAYSNSNYSTVKYNEAQRATELVSSTGDNIGMAFPAFRVNESAGEQWKLWVQYKASASTSSGFYARVYEYNSELPDGKIAVSNSATNPVVQEDTSGWTNWKENVAISTTWVTSTYTYTPTAGAKWASIVLLNWTGMGYSSLYARVGKERFFGTSSVITGSGTINKLPLWNGTSSLGDSRVSQTSSSIEILGASAQGYSRLLLKPDTGASLSLLELSHGPDPNNASVVIFGRGDASYATINSASRGTGVTQSINFHIDSDEKMRIDTDGNVGIGTANPSEKLDVRGEQVYLYNDINTNNTFFYARNSSTGNAGIKMKNSQGEWTIIANDRLRFYDDDNSVERFSILSSGNVGIGTVSPSAKLQIVDSTSGASVLKVDGTNGTLFEVVDDLSDSLMSVNDAAGLPVFEVFADNHIVAGRYNQNDFYLDGTSGNVGIGTASPNQKLEVFGNQRISNSGVLEFFGGTVYPKISRNGTSGGLIIDTAGGGVSNSVSLLSVRENGGTDFVTVLGSGNVGIGTTSPANKFHINIGTNLNWIFGYPSNTTTSLAALNDAESAYVDARIDGLTLALNSQSGGNVGIGTASPSQKLHVEGHIRVTGAYYDSNNSTGSSGEILSSTGSGTDWKTLDEIATPNAPASASATIVGETIDVTFTASTTSNIDAYLVYSSIDGSDYGLISVIPPEDFSSSMSVIDNSFNETGTQAYRVYAMKLGVLSSAATASISYAVSSAEPTSMNVVDLNNAFYVQWNPPSSNERFVTAYNVYKDENASQASLNRSNASLVYSGLNTSYMYQINGSNNNNFHQFWVETTIA